MPIESRYARRLVICCLRMVYALNLATAERQLIALPDIYSTVCLSHRGTRSKNFSHPSSRHIASSISKQPVAPHYIYIYIGARSIESSQNTCSGFDIIQHLNPLYSGYLLS